MRHTVKVVRCAVCGKIVGPVERHRAYGYRWVSHPRYFIGVGYLCGDHSPLSGGFTSRLYIMKDLKLTAGTITFSRSFRMSDEGKITPGGIYERKEDGTLRRRFWASLRWKIRGWLER